MHLVILSLKYPFGLGEAFLHEEVLYLSQHFEKITIIPSKSDGEKRPLPDNVHCLDCVGEDEKILNVFLKYPVTFFKVFLRELIHNPHRIKYLKYWKSFVGHCAADLRGYESLKALIASHNLQSCLFYDYWFTNKSLSLAKLKRKKTIRKFILRAHRFDLYDDVQYEETVPFRMNRLKYADRIFTISRHGKDYLDRRAGKYCDKIQCSYLGVKQASKIILEKSSEELLIVSCGRLIPSKQSHKMPMLLQNHKGTKLKWVHFGDGPLKEELLKNVELLSPSVSFEFKGEVPNQVILDFYKSNYVDLFVSLSLSEGIPVSIMEAMMHGIPVLAYGVNGVPEIVSDNTGWSLSPEQNISDINISFNIEEQTKLNRERIRDLTIRKFDSEINYRSFLNELNQIH